MTATLAGSRAPYDRTLFWRDGNQDAVREGKRKYLNEGGTEFLFDLDEAAREQADFKGRHPDVFGRLRAAHKEWQAGVLPRP